MLFSLDDPQSHVGNEIEDHNGDHIQPDECVRDYVEGFSWHVKQLAMRTVNKIWDRTQHPVQIRPHMERLLQPCALPGAQPPEALPQPHQTLPLSRHQIRNSRIKLSRHAKSRARQNLDARL